MPIRWMTFSKAAHHRAHRRGNLHGAEQMKTKMNTYFPPTQPMPDPLRQLRVVVLLFLMALVCGSARGQMTTGSDMTDFAGTFGISAKDWSVQEASCSLGANALWPGEQATFTFFVKPGLPYKGPLKVDVVHYGTKGKPGDWWKPIVFNIHQERCHVFAPTLTPTMNLR
jgi:hypothetical protein